MDEIDRKILRLLQDKPELSTTDLAEAVGLSHTPCWRRLKRLREDGVIVGNAVLLDPRKLGLSLTVIAEIRLKQHDEDTLEAFERAVRGYPEIVECFTITGDYDFYMRMVMGSIEEYERFLKKVLLHLPGVTAVNTRFALREVKLTTKLPIR